MTVYQAINTSVEVNGQTVLSVLNALTAKIMGLNILADNGIIDPKPESWYSQQAWLNAFKQISEKIGQNTLMKIGASIPESAKFPPHIDDVHKALESINIAYHMNHRISKEPMFNPTTGQTKEGIGSYRYKKIDNTSAEVCCDNPYPSAFNKGIIEAMAKKFKPAGSVIDVEQKDVGGLTTFTVRW